MIDYTIGKCKIYTPKAGIPTYGDIEKPVTDKFGFIDFCVSGSFNVNRNTIRITGNVENERRIVSIV